MSFHEPDTKVVKQGYRETDFMYLIQQGSCKVSIYDVNPRTKKLEDIQLKVLNKSDFFGEISMIHDSVRTATVTCSNYCTLGKIKLNTLYELASNYPFFRQAMMKHIMLYQDQVKIFIESTLRDIPYLKNCSEETISAITRSMKQDFMETGANYYTVGEPQECFSIIQEGVIHLTTVMDNGTPVILEKLTRGAILGARTFLVADENQITAVCASPVQLFTIDRYRFAHLVQNDKALFKELLKIQDEMLV